MKTATKLSIAYSLGLLSMWLVSDSVLNPEVDESADQNEATGPSHQFRGGSQKSQSWSAGRPPQSQRLISPEEAASQARLALNLSDSMVRQMTFSRILSEATPENIPHIRAVFREFDRSGLRYDREWHMLWHQWGAIDPEAALQTLNEETARGGKYGLEPILRIFSAWGQKDPDAAYDALESLDDPRKIEASYLGMINGMPLEAATEFAEQSEFEGRSFPSKVAENLADRKLRESNSISELKSWHEGLGESLQSSTLAHVYWRIRQADFEDAASWISEQADAGAPVDRIAAEMGDVYLKRKDYSGLNWYLELPEEVQKPGKLKAWYGAIDTDSPKWKEWSAANPEKALRLEATTKQE